MTGAHAVLLDIEGTTTPITFVVDVLFPYARRHLRRHLDEHATVPAYQSLCDRLRVERDADRRAGENVPDSVVSYVEWLMDRDAKPSSLKSLQGWIWEEGYARGELVGEVFDDVPAALERWHSRNMTIGIFSSGSVLAQQLLYRHSKAGDLTRFIQRYFDTTVGKKSNATSYARIANEWAIPPAATLFVSDVIGELDAARDAGMQTRLSCRPGNKPLPPAPGHAVIQTFDELVFDRL